MRKFLVIWHYVAGGTFLPPPPWEIGLRVLGKIAQVSYKMVSYKKKVCNQLDRLNCILTCKKSLVRSVRFIRIFKCVKRYLGKLKTIKNV